MADEIMTVEELAKYLKTGVATIYKLAQEGKIPATKVGNQWRFRKEKIDEWLDQGGKISFDQKSNNQR
jgi:excisionase family DNA binding protein